MGGRVAGLGGKGVELRRFEAPAHTVSVSNPQTLSLTILLQEQKPGTGLEPAAVVQER